MIVSEVKIASKKPLARSLIFKSKKYKTARKAFRWVAGVLWVGATLAVFYGQKVKKHEAIPEEEVESAHSRVRRAVFGFGSEENQVLAKDLPPEKLEYYPYEPLYTDACRAQLPASEALQVSKWNEFYQRNRDVYKERDNFNKKYYDDEKSELSLQGKQLCCLEKQDKHFHHQGAKSEFPHVGVFTDEELKSGAFIIHLFASLYLFSALAIVCDDYFVPALERISEELSLSEDVAGATFMAAGSSAPELFTSVIGVFVAKSDIGIGTIVGSAVFNILVIIGACGLFVPGDIHLSWWPLFRDSTFYLLTILLLLFVIFPEFDNDNCPDWEHKELFQCQDPGYFSNPAKYQSDVAKKGEQVKFVDFCECPSNQIPWGRCKTWKKKQTKRAKESKINCANPTQSQKDLPDGSKQNTGMYNTSFAAVCTCTDYKALKFDSCRRWKATKDHVQSKYQCSTKNYRRDNERFLQECTCKPFQGVGRSDLLSGDIAKCGKSEVHMWEAVVMLGLYCLYIVIMKYNEPLEKMFKSCCGGSKDNEDATADEAVKLNGEGSRLIATPLQANNYNNNSNNDYATCGSFNLDEQRAVEDVVSQDGSKPGMDFDNAGMRVMMSTNFAPKTRLRMAAKLVSKHQEDCLVAEETQPDGTVKTILIQKKVGHSDSKCPDPMGYNENNNNNNDEPCSDHSGEEEEDEESEGPQNPFELPSDGFSSVTKFLVAWPINVLLWYTVPQCAKEEYRHLYIISFFMSTVWIAVYSYLMVWMVAYCGFALGIPDTIMGLTFLAAGTSVPDTIASVLVAKQGMGDMAVSNSIGSNVFDILLGLALPWALQMMVAESIPPPPCPNLAQFTPTVIINSKGLVVSVSMLLLSLIFVVSVIHFNGWKLNTKAGFLITITYVLFIFGSIWNESQAAIDNGRGCDDGLREFHNPTPVE